MATTIKEANENFDKHTEKRALMLELAETIGQKEALNRMLEFAPESQANYWAIIDFNKPSSEERLFIFSIKDNNFKKYLVAHGSRSGELYATEFSNVNGSHCSSLGIYKTKNIFRSGHHGDALIIKGLEPTNSNAEQRDIIIHKADYVLSNFDGLGRSGRSLGCFAVTNNNIDEILSVLRDGSYINAWHI
jgi:L,D-transpeptidase catalytic domain